MAAPLTSQTAKDETLVRHDDFGASIIDKDAVLQMKVDDGMNNIFALSIIVQLFSCCLSF